MLLKQLDFPVPVLAVWRIWRIRDRPEKTKYVLWSFVGLFLLLFFLVFLSPCSAFLFLTLCWTTRVCTSVTCFVNGALLSGKLFIKQFHGPMVEISLQRGAEWGQSLGLLLSYWHLEFTFEFESGLGTVRVVRTVACSEDRGAVPAWSAVRLLVMLLCPSQQELLCACMFGYYLCWGNSAGMASFTLLTTPDNLKWIRGKRKRFSVRLSQNAQLRGQRQRKRHSSSCDCQKWKRAASPYPGGWSTGFPAPGDFGHMCWNTNKSGLGTGEAIWFRWNGFHWSRWAMLETSWLVYGLVALPLYFGGFAHNLCHCKRPSALLRS